MVYESDFYTTRRPYSRPLVSSYTVTSPTIIPISSVVQVRTLPYLPYVAHKRLVTIVHSPYHSVYHTGTSIPIRIHSRVRPSIIAAEMNRIRDLPRSRSTSYTENYLNSKDHIFFDDETREIRAKADALLRRIHVFVPRTLASDFLEEIIPERMRSDDYIRRLLTARKNAKKDIDEISWYAVPEQRHIGKGNLSCIRYIGGRPQSRRRPYVKVADLRPVDIKNDVNLLSYYSKNRQAAERASPVEPLTEREIRKARALETDWTPTPPKKAAAPAELEPEPLAKSEPEPEPVSEKKKEKKEKKHKEKEVRKPAVDEEALRKAEEFLAKQAEEARFEEERRKAAEEERLRLEREEEEARLALEKAQEEARLAEVAEQERLEAERKAEEERLEAERLEAERRAEEERLAAEAATAAAIAEEERLAAERAAAEDARKKQEEEERFAAETAIAEAAVEEQTAANEDTEEPTNLAEETDQEQEETPADPIVDDDAKVEEQEYVPEEEPEETENDPFVEEPVDPEGGENQAEEPITVVEDAPQVEKLTSGGEETIEEIDEAA